MKREIILAVAFIWGCGADEPDFSDKDFSKKFKDGYVESCESQARGMSSSDAKKYCRCSLIQMMTYWDSEKEAGSAMEGMAPYEIQRILVTPCLR
mgnify:FL=1